MNKRKAINELTNILAIALRHKIGSRVNSNEIYAEKYAKDADVLIKEAQKVSFRENWNYENKEEIKNLLKTKLLIELEKKKFIDNKKFELVDEEIKKALFLLNLD